MGFADRPAAYRFHPERGTKSPSESEASGQETRPDRKPPPRIVIVEDDWFIAIENEALLLQASYEIAGIAGNARDALALVERCRPDLALVDIHLEAGDDGVEVAKTIRERFGVPCIFVTAYGDAKTRERAEAARPRSWLIKPFTGDQLLSAVQQALLQAN